MAIKTIKRVFLYALTITGIALMAVSMFVLTQSTKSSGGFQEWQGPIFLINLIGVLTLSTLIVINIWRLYKQYKQRIPGTRLTINMLLLLLPLVLVPLAFMFYFSTQFSNDAVDSWFNVDVEEGLQEALNLSRRSLDETKGDHLSRSKGIANAVSNIFGPDLIFAIDDLRIQAFAHEVTVFGINGEVIANSISETGGGIPGKLSDEMKLLAQQGAGFVGLDTKSNGQLVIRTVVKIPQSTPIDAPRLLQVEYLTTERVSALASNAETVINRYNQLISSRTPLKQGFTLALGLTFLLSMLAAVWASFAISRRLVQPIQTLATGTQAVAEGDFHQQLSVESSDEIGFLTQSFNAMTKRLAYADEQMQKSQMLVENERANLAAILSRLSTGVISFDHDLKLRRANHAANEILECDFDNYSRHYIADIKNEDGLLQAFLEQCRLRIEKGQTEWREEFALSSTARGRRVFVVACSVLAGEQEEQGIVIVFDDVTRLIRAQRDSAWGEVARRLAHEIKNPLTPIQLSAERLRYRYLDNLPEDQKDVMDKATQTIISQVDAMKNMVDAFRDYARAPQVNFEKFDLSELLQEIVLLYKPRDSRIEVHVELYDHAIMIDADRDRLRQIMHNLFSNAYDALNAELENPENSVQAGKIWLQVHEIKEGQQRYVEIELADSGSGFDEKQMGDLFEPYVTTKSKGTGLGLAIVRKLVEEHNGDIQIANHYLDKDKSGAVIKILLPADEATRLKRVSKGSHSRENIKSSNFVKLQGKVATLKAIDMETRPEKEKQDKLDNQEEIFKQNV
jgi:nitrogen fixation/metabolism regulation signal transduction histidine kinase